MYGILFAVCACTLLVPLAHAEPPTMEPYFKMDSRLLQTYESATADAPVSNSSAPGNDKRIQVVLEMKSASYSIPQNLGIEVQTAYENLVQATVPVRNLEVIAADENVKRITLPHRPTFGTDWTGADRVQLQTSARNVISEGAGVMGADTANDDGYTGSGVKLAVIDSGFVLDNPEISGNIKEHVSFIEREMYDDDIVHGTGVAEIVVDVAPDVELYLYEFDTGIEFFNLIDHIIERGDIDIITASFGWTIFPADGTSRVSQKVNETRDNGILWLTAVANNAERHWQGTFSDRDGDGLHNFSGDDQTLDIMMYPYDRFWIDLLWDDDWEDPANDYDLYLYDGSELLASSTNRQVIHHPYETVEYWFHDYTTAKVVIKKYDATRNVHFHMHASIPLTEYADKNSSIGVPEDARGSFSVGASEWEDDSLAVYSSHGPTWDGRIKPDITGPTRVSTTAYPHPFEGTSSATPHVAGAAALVMEKYPDATADQVQHILESIVYERHAKSNQDGTGRADVSMLVGTDILALDNDNRRCASSSQCFYPSTLNVSLGETVTWINTGNAPITIRGSGFESGNLFRGDRYSMTFTQPGTFSYADGINTWASGQIIVDSAVTSNASIQGTVFSDTNNNRIMDAGEQGIETTVTLPAVSRHANTDAMGRYSFTGLAPGEYAISVTVPNEFDIAVGESVSKTVTVAGGESKTVDFALVPIPSATTPTEMTEEGLTRQECTDKEDDPNTGNVQFTSTKERLIRGDGGELLAFIGLILSEENAREQFGSQYPSICTYTVGFTTTDVTLNIYSFEDTNGDGVQSQDEDAAAEIPILLYVPANGEADLLITETDGTASKTDLQPRTFYAIALPPEGTVATTHQLELGGTTYSGVIRIEHPAPGSTHTMNVGIMQDPCHLIPEDSFAAVLLDCE